MAVPDEEINVCAAQNILNIRIAVKLLHGLVRAERCEVWDEHFVLKARDGRYEDLLNGIFRGTFADAAIK